ncbi:MAG: AmmeMemoRadiSam system protein B, partial [Elusimicrobiales bacterium]|nr:AmmeMemoRadiSam system protein B [Elusimicrobiales bacterium]
MRIKKASIEGRFYPATKKEVFDFISLHFDSDTPNKGRIILSPHAGYVFSGLVSAKSYSHLIPNFSTAIVLGTAHTTYAMKCLTLKNTIFKNCIGEVKTDDLIIDELLKTELFEEDINAFENEHSVEVQIPFLQYLNKDFKIVPLVVGGGNKEYFDKAGKVIASILKKMKDVVLIISCDLSHYPPYEVAYVVDNALAFSYVSASINKNLEYFIMAKNMIEEKYRKKLDTVACGFAAMSIGLSCAIEMDLVFNIVKYLNSGDVMENHRDEVVGYLSGFFSDRDIDEWKFNLNKDEKSFLIHLARNSIDKVLKGESNYILDYIQYPKLNLPCAVFVTLTINGELRGCIGTLTPHMLMADSVCEYSVKAAFEDPRFEPLSKDEFKKINIEISLLSPLIKIKDLSEIKENFHGVYVKRG